MQIEAPPSAPPTEPALQTGERWQAFACLLTAAFLPATTAQRTNHVSLFAAWRVHFLASLIVLIEIGLMSACFKMDRWSVTAFFNGLTEFWQELLGELNRYPEEVTAAAAGTTVGVEVGFVVLGLLVAPWGARVEPLRASIAHGVRRVWLQTPHAIWALALVTGFIVPLFSMSRSWHMTHTYPPYSVSVASPGPNATPQELEAYNKAQQDAAQESMRRWQAWRDSQPWYVRHDEETVALLSFALGIWFLWALLRAVGAPRQTPQIHPPPLCEFCGYNLTTMPMEARCPECGEPIVLSLGPDVRRGTTWQRRAQLGWLRGYAQSVVDAVFFPVRLGRQIRLFTPGADHRFLVGLHVALILVISYCGFLTVVYAADGSRAFDRQPELLVIALIPATLVTSLALGLLLLAAGVAGVDRYLRDRRNLLPASMQVAGYLSAALAAGLAFAWLSGAYAVSGPQVLRRWGRSLQTDWELVAFMVWAGVNLAWVGLWLLTLWRAVAAARFANR